MTQRILTGMTRSAAAKEVAAIFRVSVSTAYKSYTHDDNGYRRVPLKKSNVRLEYGKCIDDGTLTMIYKVLKYAGMRPETVVARLNCSRELVDYARKWGPKFIEYENKVKV